MLDPDLIDIGGVAGQYRTTHVHSDEWDFYLVDISK